jgi:5'-methylthioadenosine phosphorylase
MANGVPPAAIGSIGGSGTWGARFPEDLGRSDVKVLRYVEPVETPYGLSCESKLLDVAGERVLRVAMHGWHRDAQGTVVPTWVCSLQVAWLFQLAGVQWALVDGSVGGIQRPDQPGTPLAPWSVVITDDFIQYWAAPTLGQSFGPTGRLREPFCAGLRRHLRASAEHQERFTVYDGGVYVCTPTGRFETPAEIRMMAGWGGHIVGQTLGHELPLMRQLRIHFASLNIVSNFAEGEAEWIGDRPEAMAEFYRACPKPVGDALVDTFVAAISGGIGPCRCDDYALTGLSVFPVDGA